MTAKIREWLKGHHSIIITPSTTGGTKHYQFSNKIISLVGVFSGILAIAFIVFAFNYFHDLFVVTKYKKLKEENTLLNQRLSQLDSLKTVIDKNQILLEHMIAISTISESTAASDTMGNGELLAEYEDSSFNNLLPKLNQHDQVFLSMLKDHKIRGRDALQMIPTIWPVRGVISNTFNDDHHGIDIVVPVGTEVVASADGQISFAGEKDYFGMTIEIDHGLGFKTMYAHNNKLLVGKGQKVIRGQQIALSGNTGESSGPHLHYAVFLNEEPQDPFNYIESEKGDEITD